MQPLKFCLLTVLICCGITGWSQRIDKVHFNLTGSVGIPSSKLKAAVDNSIGGLGVGLGASVLVNPMGKVRNSPFQLGVDFTYLTFGRDKTAETSTTPPYKTSFNFYSAGGMIRFFPLPDKTGLFPFVDGILGAKIMNARTKVDKDLANTLNNDEDEVINNATHTGLGYALGIGFFNRKLDEDENGNIITRPSFTLRVLYHWGAEVRHVKRGSVQVNNGQVTFEQARTDLNMLMVHLGVYIF